jgi:hypothetical protein
MRKEWGFKGVFVLPLLCVQDLTGKVHELQAQQHTMAKVSLIIFCDGFP